MTVLAKLKIPAAAGMAVMLSLSGCQRSEEITRYTIPKPQEIFARNHVDRPAESPAARPGGGMRPGESAAADQRLIGAIFPRSTRTWFFKLMGPDRVVQEQMEGFLQLVGTVRFGDGEDSEPTWTLPHGWEQTPGSGMRFATVWIDAGAAEPLELSVIPLPTAGSPNDVLLSNINRWRGQVGLEPTTFDQLFDESDRFEETRKLTVNGIEATLVNVAGPKAPSRLAARAMGPVNLDGAVEDSDAPPPE
jgi:hypothetical protein